MATLPLQQCETTEALRTALGRMEAALMAREQKLTDSYKVLRMHADGLRSSADSSLKVKVMSSPFLSCNCMWPHSSSSGFECLLMPSHWSS